MPGPDNENEEYDPDFLRSRREAFWIVAAWAVCMVWTLGYGALFGYDLDAEKVTTTFGMPTWIFWGVALPWFLATVFSIWFAVRVIGDHALDEVEGESEDGTEEERA